VFGVTSTGPWIGQVLEDLIAWQLGNPSASKAECREWLKKQGADKYIPKDENERNFQKPSKRVRVK
jgi:tRNA nucleotidyltransferase (CCA-adding enzyme)